MKKLLLESKLPRVKNYIGTAVLTGCIGFGIITPAFSSTNEKSDAFYQEAVTEYQQGNIAEAMIQLRNAVQQDPSNMNARLLLGKMYLQTGNVVSSIKELQIVHDKRPNDESELALGEAFFASGQYDKAIAIVSNDALTPDMVVKKQIVRGDILLAQQNVSGAEKAFSNALSVEKTNKKALYGLARTMTVQGNLDEATAIMEDILKEDPEFVSAWILKGEIGMSEGRRNEAFSAFNKAIELEPKNINAYVSRARANLTAGRLEEARVDSERVKDLAPNNPIGKYLTASIAYSQDDLEAAAAEYVQIEETYRSFPPAILLGALIKFKQNNLNQSESLLTRYLNIEPENTEARRILALIRIKNDDVLGGQNILKKLVRDNPDDIASLQFLASAYLQGNKFEEAAQVFQQIIKRGTAGSVRQADAALKLLSKKDSAEISPENADLGRQVLVVLNYINSNQLDKAESSIERLKVTYPDNPLVTNLEGGLLLTKKDYKTARTVFENALEKDPTFISAIDNLDRIDYIEGTPENVEKRLDRLLGLSPDSEDLIMRKVQFLSNNNRLEQGVKLLEEKNKSIGNSEILQQALVRTNFSLNRIQAAGNAAEKLVSMSDSPDQLIFATGALLDANMPGSAVSAAEKLNTIEPDSAQVKLMLAKAYVANQNVEKARSSLQAAFNKNPSNPIARGLVDIALGMNDQEQAFNVIEQFAKTNPDMATRLRANTLLKLGNQKEAVALLLERMKEDPSEDTVIDLFLANRASGDLNAALDGLENWISKHPESRRALTAYASTLLDMDRLKEAGNAYRKLISVDPNNASALNNFAWIRNELGQADALDYAEKAYRLAPSSPEIADTFGWLMVQNGKLKDGLEILRAAAGVARNNPDILYHLAYALAKSGQNDDALVILKVLVDKGGNFASRDEAMKLYSSLS